MSDENNNDELMTQFIEKASPKLLEALSTQVAELVEKQVGGLVENSAKLLDEVKTARDEKSTELEQIAQLKTLLERGESPAVVKDALNPEPVKLTREQARDPQLYRRAKASAEASGTRVEIV